MANVPTLFADSPTTTRRKDTKFRQFRFTFHGRELNLQGYERLALKYLVSIGVKPSDIVCECENAFDRTLRIRYTYGRKQRTYMPDMYLKSTRTVVEVKSAYTLGLLGNKKRGWSMTCAKAKATLDAGFGFVLLLMRDDGTRIQLPKGWYRMKKQDVIDALGSQLKANLGRAISTLDLNG